MKRRRVGTLADLALWATEVLVTTDGLRFFGPAIRLEEQRVIEIRCSE